MIASNSECNYKGKLSENMLCAGAKGKDACIGASGGPAIGASGGPATGETAAGTSWCQLLAGEQAALL